MCWEAVKEEQSQPFALVIADIHTGHLHSLIYQSVPETLLIMNSFL